MSDSPAAPARTRTPADWWFAFMSLLLFLWVVVSVIYALGGSGISYSGASVSFNRQYDRTLFKIDDTHALQLSGNEDRTNMMLCKHTVAMFPLNILAGYNMSDGKVVSGIDLYRSGDWIISDEPEGGEDLDFVDAFNTNTGETLTITAEEVELVERMTEATDKDGISRWYSEDQSWRVNAVASLPTFTAAGIDPENTTPVTQEWVATNFGSMSTLNESAMTYQMAFVALFLLMIVLYLPTLVFGRKVVPAAPKGEQAAQ